MKSQNIKIYLPILILMTSLCGQAFADLSGGGGKNSKLSPIRDLIDDKQYQKAIEASRTALEESPGDADLINLLAYSHRQLGQLELARSYYLEALDIDPDHRGANEYLGELYLLTHQLDKAMERLEVLDKECFFPCSEYRDLKKAIEAYRKP